MKKSLLSAVALTALMAFSGSAWADILVGVAGPITGPNAAFGAQLQKGAEQAAADINAAGGINGEQIKISVGDDVSDPKQGISVANKFVADGVKFVVGHFNSGVSIPASEVYAENGILEITPAATNPVFTERGLWNTFRTCGRDDQQGAVAGAYIAANFKDAKIAVIHDKTPYGQGLADETKKALNAAGVTEAMYEGVNVGDKDFSALIAKMKDAGVTMIYWGGLHTEAGLIIRQTGRPGPEGSAVLGRRHRLERARLDRRRRGCRHAATPSVPIRATTRTPRIWSRSSAPPASSRRPTRSTPTPRCRSSPQAAAAAGSNDPQEVAKAIKEKGPFKTVLGELSFNEKGDRTDADYVVYQWKKGDDGKYNYFQL